MTATTKIALVGAAGRMGLEIIRAIHRTDGVVLGAAVEHSACPVLGRDPGELAGIGSLGIQVTSDLAAVIGSCNVILDLSLPIATDAVIETARAGRTPLVCGTTGVSDATLDHFDQAARDIPVLHSKNFSVGVNVLAALVKNAVTILGNGYDIEIVEMHHRNKVDAPSGTALLLAETAASATNRTRDVFRFGREGNTGTRTTEEIGIHGVRGGGVVGDHTVILAGPSERIELTHRADSRALLAEGAVRTACFLSGAAPGRYTMNNVLGIAD